jgi:hypothetical protein
MKSGTLIKLLQEIDPSGELHVRASNGEAIYGVERKEGYWDGPYMYFEDDNIFEKLYISSKGEKIDIKSAGYEDVIWQDNGDISRIKIIGEDSSSYKEHFEKVSKEAKRFHENSIKEFTFTVMHKILSEGFKIGRMKKNDSKKLEDKLMFYFKKNFLKERKDLENQLNQGSKCAVEESGLFDEIDHGNWVEWRLKNVSQGA